ncbi:hypothetical protein FPV67DRAFT_298202 [Lyophyllum atratum]|nr:hypothetical protein FPV67DRAFT_298202 [Lyophyllum atratum]
MSTVTTGADGIKSVPAAAVFAVLYLPMFILFVYQSFRRPSPVFYTLSFFCALRMASFAMRAVIAATMVDDPRLLTADQVLFSIGFFGLLYSAYTLILDRELVSEVPISTRLIPRFIRHRRLYRLALLVAVILGSVGISETNSSNPSTVSLGQGLHQASTAIFLALVVLLAYQTLILAKITFADGRFRHQKGSLGAKYGVFILFIISVLLLIREAFATATTNDLETQNNEHLWYPLIAMPEFIAVVLYSTPDLVPVHSELPRAEC